MPLSFTDIDAKFGKLMNLRNDPILLRIAFSVYLANFMEGPPVWMIVLGGSGSGKTELIGMFGNAKRSHMVSSITPAALLSFTAKETSLLYAANYKVLIVRDMSTITQADRTEKGLLYGYLRDAYDGEFRRASGKGILDWEGKIGIIGADYGVPYASNCCFGDRDFRLLFITSRDKALGIRMKVRGVKPLPARGDDQ